MRNEKWFRGALVRVLTFGLLTGGSPTAFAEECVENTAAGCGADVGNAPWLARSLRGVHMIGLVLVAGLVLLVTLELASGAIILNTLTESWRSWRERRKSFTAG